MHDRQPEGGEDRYELAAAKASLEDRPLQQPTDDRHQRHDEESPTKGDMP